jgi:hypothetical protein
MYSESPEGWMLDMLSEMNDLDPDDGCCLY